MKNFIVFEKDGDNDSVTIDATYEELRDFLKGFGAIYPFPVVEELKKKSCVTTGNEYMNIVIVEYPR